MLIEHKRTNKKSILKQKTTHLLSRPNQNLNPDQPKNITWLVNHRQHNINPKLHIYYQGTQINKDIQTFNQGSTRKDN